MSGVNDLDKWGPMKKQAGRRQVLPGRSDAAAISATNATDGDQQAQVMRRATRDANAVRSEFVKGVSAA